MDEKTFLEELEEILNVEEPLTLETRLDDLEEWDSLASLMFQSFVFKRVKVIMKPTDLKNAQTVADLYAFLPK